MELLEYLTTGQLALIDVNDGRVTKVGCPNLIRSVSMAPGEEQFRVATVKKPFSYYVPFARFGSQEGIWSTEGKNLYTLADRDLRDNEPQQPPTTPNTPTTGQTRMTVRARTPSPTQTQTDPDPDPTPDPTTDPDPDTPRRGATPPTDPDGKRELGWRPDGNGLSFLQLEPAKKEETDTRKDRVMQWLPPFGEDDVQVVYETPHRIARAQYSEDGKWLFLTQMVDNQRQITAVDLSNPKTTHVIDRSGGSSGSNRATNPSQNTPKGDDPPSDGEDDEQQPRPGLRPGGFVGTASSLMTRPIGGGVSVVRVSSSGEVYLTGTERTRGSDSQAYPKPFIDKVDIVTGKKTRIYEGKGDMLETIDAIDSSDVKYVFTTRQKPDVVPDSYRTELATGESIKLTNNQNRTPWFNKLKVQRFQVTRVDGFKFWVRVTTPPDAKEKLPALFWIYPREYTDQAAYNAAAGRTAATSGRFTAPAPRSMTLLTLIGYAVVEPDIPIVGPAGRMNDNYIPDLRNSLWAVIDELDKRGIIDRDRLACGGHSYGAFSTANALAHTPFFKAGIAGDGNYNRTLTMMSFQTERRHLWDARETYLEMSPLLWANRVNGALLMYHGMDDANVGTHPMNAEQLFLALDGLGKPAALYMYPHEGHGPATKETTLDLWARWVAWLDKYVKNAHKS
jgi:dipeptidyl aminopeptidase/acylaminoacyl peptidase